MKNTWSTTKFYFPYLGSGYEFEIKLLIKYNILVYGKIIRINFIMIFSIKSDFIY